jgi:hypothetical protein
LYNPAYPGFWEFKALLSGSVATTPFTVKGVLLVVDDPSAYYTEPIHFEVYSNYRSAACAIHWESGDVAERPVALLSIGPITGTMDISLDLYGYGTGTADLSFYWGYFWYMKAQPHVLGAPWSAEASVERWMYEEF